jgi:hypothetical protein
MVTPIKSIEDVLTELLYLVEIRQDNGERKLVLSIVKENWNKD